MGAEETKHDLWAKRIHTWIGIFGGAIASVAAAYNFLPSFIPVSPGEVVAVVREQSGAPVPHAHVELLSSQKVLLNTSETDRNGRYAKSDLQPGSYVLKVTRGAFEPQVAMVIVTSKNTADLDVVLKSRSRPQSLAIPQTASASQGNAMRSALEEAGAAWMKSFGRPAK